ncbi:TrbG/VirB9 family P-type conjugative transfer protein [Sandaracinobacteroides saxicola]|uniref:TrbG/VirB9 family P-type conjugative transfer protein n=1 Tax=Sandaracinobacteroides saxicola TaxID=2759707 RepID=A0A7G5IGG8_9SPHN|nr:TrbG/VirB9 family P-type conjugative transfer protein [Sandaracinobacteroides saxicola]QMW22460.1 TrbG/VirB9 family P-type conjugative transfer protein [Sandaracinobacteroides saxicola]
MMREAILFTALCVAAGACAQTRPVPGPGDPRVQIVSFEPNQVVELELTAGTAVMVSFSSSERVETIALGDSAAWAVTPTKRADAIFIKALSGAESNLTVVTDARTYLMRLRAGGGLVMPAYAVRFVYPLPANVGASDKSSPTVSFTYRIRGSRTIRPARIEQIGENTAISWDKAVPLPAVFQVTDDGTEALVNGEMQNDRFIVEGHPKTIIFRLDGQRATAQRVDRPAERR